MSRARTYQKWFNILGRKFLRPSSTNIPLSSRKDFTQKILKSTPALGHDSYLHNRTLFVLPWEVNPGKWSTRFNQKIFRFGTEAVKAATSVPVRVAHELHKAGHHYLDVRTPEEFSDGHAIGAINIPYMYKVGSGMENNPKFVEEVFSQFEKHEKLIIGCRSGKRSLMATTDLLAAGYIAITDVAGGYDAWIKDGLPTEK